MNAAQFHLLINHLPIIGLAIGILIMVVGIFLKNQTVSNVAMGLFILAAIGGFAAMQSGEGAEEIVENLKVVGHKVIHEHEESAEVFSWLLGLHGLICLFILFTQYRGKSIFKNINILILISSLIIMYFAANTGHTGGLIRHPEISDKVATEVLNGNQPEEED